MLNSPFPLPRLHLPCPLRPPRPLMQAETFPEAVINTLQGPTTDSSPRRLSTAHEVRGGRKHLRPISHIIHRHGLQPHRICLPTRHHLHTRLAGGITNNKPPMDGDRITPSRLFL
ncbi:hypothetical protein IMZ48_46055 [Candidatus Bathyarchaeota archaeon]|nr:hypothetical protein [Candidatus Bathyarchaeota archaeon]